MKALAVALSISQVPVYLPTSLLIHSYTLYRKSRYPCDKCCATFGSTSNLRKHTKSIHSHIGDIHMCKDCKGSFPTKEQLKRHVTAYHLNRMTEPTHTCDVCSKVYGHLRQLQRHQKRIHNSLN